jgi:hypothetical protein
VEISSTDQIRRFKSMSIASSMPAREADEGVEMKVEMDMDTGAGGPGQEDRASPPPLKVMTAESAAGPGANEYSK